MNLFVYLALSFNAVCFIYSNTVSFLTLNYTCVSQSFLYCGPRFQNYAVHSD